MLKAATAARRGMPEKFAEIEEKTEPWMEFFLKAFFDLSTDRQAGMALMPIPWSAIQRYAEVHSFVGELLFDFHHIIRCMDDHYLSTANKKEDHGQPSSVREKDSPHRP